MQKKIVIGSPKGLFYYSYFPLIKKFFRNLGEELFFSSDTDKRILDLGLKISETELCLPIKAYLGHVKALSSLADVLFLLTYASIEKNKWTCPKIVMVNRIVKNDFPDIPAFDFTVLLRESINPIITLKRGFSEILHKVMGIDTKKINSAFRDALIEHREYKKKVESFSPASKPAIALIGHPYVIWDHFLNLNIMERLDQMGISYVTSENIPFEKKREEVSKLQFSRSLNWTPCQDIIGSALYFAPQSNICGIIFLSMFGCGYDPISEEFIMDPVRKDAKKPYMKILIDEHTSDVALITKLEAFIDTVSWGK